MVLNADVASMMCAAAHNVATLLIAISTITSMRPTLRQRSARHHHRADGAHSSELHVAAEPVDARYASSDRSALRDAVAEAPTSAKAELQRALRSAQVSFTGLRCNVHIGPRDVVALHADAYSSACAQSWTLPRFVALMNGSRVLEGAGLEVSVSRVAAAARAAGEVRAVAQSLCTSRCHAQHASSGPAITV